MASFNLTPKTTLEEFRKELLDYVNKYNNTIHSQLNNVSPLTRFFDSGEEIIIVNEEKLDKDFLLEIDRKATADCVIQIDNILFEVPQIYSNKSIKIRYSADFSTCYVVEANQSLTKIELLDKVANSKIKRKQPIFNLEENK